MPFTALAHIVRAATFISERGLTVSPQGIYSAIWCQHGEDMAEVVRAHLVRAGFEWR